MDRSALKKMTKAALMEEAKRLDLPGRSKMNKAELIEALSRRQRAKKPPVPSRKSGKVKGPSLLRSGLGYRGRERPERVPDTYQEEVERGRYDLGLGEEAYRGAAAPGKELAPGYGDNRIVLMVRDPHWLYSYWEIQQSRIDEVLAENDLSGQHFQSVLRIYHNDETSFHDIDVEGLLNNWYINVGRPDEDFFVEIGVRVQDRFLPLARSNRVRTPRAGMSQVVDDQWMTLDEEARTLYALSGGFRIGEASLELQEMMERRLFGEVSSGAVSSFFGSGQFRERPRGFWYHLDAELIVYGATEPDAKVTLQGRPIQLRPDGTFTARLSLPDGRQEIPVTFVSFDEVDSGTITPKVSRKTDKA